MLTPQSNNRDRPSRRRQVPLYIIYTTAFVPSRGVMHARSSRPCPLMCRPVCGLALLGARRGEHIERSEGGSSGLEWPYDRSTSRTLLGHWPKKKSTLVYDTAMGARCYPIPCTLTKELPQADYQQGHAHATR